MPVSVLVAVCAERDPTVALRALARRASGVPVLLVTSGPAGEHLEPPADGPAGLRRLHEPRRGIAHARNRALAACEGEVLAFVDHDVAVGEDWARALRAAWAAAGDDVACLGGPIALDFPAGRPAWLGDELLGAFAPLDLGPDPMDVEGGTRTFHGGNVTFRAAALRGVGGFFPADHHGARDWFSEEHEAQRALARCGWRARYEPGLRATRCVGAEDLRAHAVLARRARYGARETVVGAPPPVSVAARRALISTAGVAVAAAGRDAARAGERAGRAAEAAGRLLGRALAGRDVRARPAPPEALTHRPPEPPARAAAVARAGALARRRLPRAAVLLYHRVTEPGADRYALSVSPRHFAEQMDVLAATYTPIALDDLVAAVGDGGPRPGMVAVTFDDGYADNLHAAAPALAAAGVPATVFVATGYVGRPSFWWDEVDRLLVGGHPVPDTLSLTIGGREGRWRTATASQRESARVGVHRWLQMQPPETVERALADLRTWAAAPPQDPGHGRPLTEPELGELAARPGIALGAHTRRHVALRFQDAAVQAEEITGSRADLEALLGRRPAAFSYPYGVPDQDFDAITRGLVIDSGYQCAVANAPGPVMRRSDPYALPRFTAPDLDGHAFAAWLRERCPPAA